MDLDYSLQPTSHWLLLLERSSNFVTLVEPRMSDLHSDDKERSTLDRKERYVRGIYLELLKESRGLRGFLIRSFHEEKRGGFELVEQLRGS